MRNKSVLHIAKLFKYLSSFFPIKSFLCCFWVLMVFVSHAEVIPHKDYYIKNYTDEDGLFQNSVSQILKDESGFIWLTTELGLVKFDGQNHRIWLAEELGNCCNKYSYLFYHPGNHHAYAVDREGGLIKIEKGKPKVNKMPGTHSAQSVYQQSRYVFGEGMFFSMVDGKPVSILRIDTNHHVLLKEKKIHFYTNDTVLTGKTDVSAFDEKEIHIKNFRVIDDDVYFQTDKKIYRIRPGRVEEIILKHHTTPVSGELYNIINSKYISDRNYLIGHHHLYKIDSIVENQFFITQQMSDFPFSEYQIHSVFYDSVPQIYYLGSLINGYFQCKPKTFKTLKTNAHHLNASQIALSGQEIMVNNGIIVNTVTGNLRHTALESYSDGLFLIKDRQGFVWTKKDNIVSVFDPANNTILKRFEFDEMVSIVGGDTLLPHIYISIPGKNKHRLLRISPEKYAYDQFESVLDFPDKIYFIAAENHETLLIATEKGLYQYRIDLKKVVFFESTRRKLVYSVYKSPSNPRFLWLSVGGNGIMRFDGKNLVEMPLDKINSGKFSHKILEDTCGNFWISTNKGMLKVKRNDWEKYESEKDQVLYQHFDKKNGFTSNEFNGYNNDVGIVLENGWFSFSAVDGIVIFDPYNIPDELPKGEIVVDRVQNGHINVPVTDTIVWKDRSNALIIQLSTPYYGSVVDIEYQYRIDGGPVIEAENGKIIINRLSAGRHYLRVSLKNGAGLNQFTTKILLINVRPEWYESYFFYAFLCLIFIITVYVVYRYSVRLLENENLRLEIAVKKRTSELEEAIQTLVESENKLNKELYFQQSLNSNISHNIKTPLRYLMSSMGRFHQMLLKQDNEVNKGESKKIFEATQELYNSTVQFVTYMKAANKLGNPQIEKIVLHDLAQDAVNFYKKFIDVNLIHILNKIDAVFLVEAPPDFLKLIINNFLDNSIKHAKADKVELETEIVNDELVFIFRDNGIGIPPEYIEMFNGYFQQSSTTSLRDVYVDIGIGYFTIKEMLPFVGARIEFSEDVEEGAEIKIIFKNYYLEEEE